MCPACICLFNFVSNMISLKIWKKKTRTEILWFLLWKSIRSSHFDIFFKKNHINIYKDSNQKQTKTANITSLQRGNWSGLSSVRPAGREAQVFCSGNLHVCNSERAWGWQDTPSAFLQQSPGGLSRRTSQCCFRNHLAQKERRDWSELF